MLTAEELLQLPIKGCDCNGSKIVMWSGRKAEVHPHTLAA
jgi:hypothetical protein